MEITNDNNQLKPNIDYDEKNNFQLKKIIIVLICILLIIIAVISLLQMLKVPKKQSSEIIFPSPTAVESKIKFPLTPTDILPTNTGVFEEEMPEEIKKIAEQKQALKFSLPVTQPEFSIAFDYGEDKFIVSLNPPQATALEKFQLWLQNNYPAIPIDRFVFR